MYLEETNHNDITFEEFESFLSENYLTDLFEPKHGTKQNTFIFDTKMNFDDKITFTSELECTNILESLIVFDNTFGFQKINGYNQIENHVSENTIKSA